MGAAEHGRSTYLLPGAYVVTKIKPAMAVLNQSAATVAGDLADGSMYPATELPKICTRLMPPRCPVAWPAWPYQRLNQRIEVGAPADPQYSRAACCCGSWCLATGYLSHRIHNNAPTQVSGSALASRSLFGAFLQEEVDQPRLLVSFNKVRISATLKYETQCRVGFKPP
jgi:hypothetical protein